VIAVNLLASQAMADSCVSESLAAYIALGTVGCQQGDKTFSNFSEVGSGTGTVPTPGDIVVAPDTRTIGGVPEIGLDFNSTWFANSGQNADTTITFDVAVVGGGGMLISDASTVQLSSAFVGTGAATVTDGICAGGPCVPTISTSTVNRFGTTRLADTVIFGDEDALALPKKQVSKCRPALFVETANLAIEDGAFDAEVFGDPGRKRGKASENVPIPRNQFALAIVEMCERSKAIYLQFANE
jgi:hypothetical protein